MFVRRDVYSLPQNDPTLKFYGLAVAEMQRRDASDPTSWAYQAAMHGTYSTPPLTLWNTCEHGTWYFTPWHRMYVLNFEAIVRAVVVSLGGPSDWALPYWNYTPADRGNPALPPAFRDPGSPLYVWERRVRPYNINKGDPLPNAVTDITLPMTRRTFLVAPPNPPAGGFGGQVTAPVHFNPNGFGALEQQPHNVVHDAVGGSYGWMADVNFAAQDPIFWLHHANIDRLWASWNTRYLNTDLPYWTQQPFQFFNGSGAPVTMSCGAVQSTQALGYQYDRLATVPGQGDGEADSAPPPAATRSELVGATATPVRLTGTHAAASVPIDARARDAALAGAADGPAEVYLRLDDIEAARNPGTVYGVYVNLPAGATDEQAEDHLAGALSFFGIEAASGRRGDGFDHQHSYAVSYDITALVGRLSERGLWDAAHVTVEFHPLGVPFGDDSAAESNLPTVTVGRVSVHYAS